MITRLQHFFHDWSESCKTYYLSYLVALFATVLWIIVISFDYSYEMELGIFYELLATCAIAFPLFLLWPLYNQTHNKPDYKIVIVTSLIGTVLSLLFAWYVAHYNVFGPDQPDIQSHIIVVLLSYLIAWGSVLATVAYAHPRDNLTTRWRWKELFVHIVIAWLGSAILRGGIAASLGSIDYLFEVDIDDKWYAYVGVISFLIIGVSIFLTNLHRTKYEESYHSFFRFFGLYIFFPLAIIYACILLVYGGKIVITQTRPKGLISMMVIGYTIWGLIAYLLTYPLQESLLVNKMRSAYFISILVFVLLLFGAIGIRISQYGITESRYLIVMIGLWIIIVGIASLIRPKKTFSTMIFTLLWLAISSAYLPRGAGPISLSSQKNRLESLLEKNGFWDGNKLIVQEKNVENMSETEQKELSQASDVIDYLTQSFGSESLSYLYTNSATWFQELLDQENNWTIGDMFIRKLGIIGELPWVYDRDVLWEPKGQYFTVYTEFWNTVVDISNYRYMVDIDAWKEQSSENSLSNDNQNIQFSFSWSTRQFITVTDKGQDILELNINDFAQELYERSLKQDTKPYIIQRENYTLIIKNASGQKKSDGIIIDYISFTLLIK